MDSISRLTRLGLALVVAAGCQQGARSKLDDRTATAAPPTSAKSVAGAGSGSAAATPAIDIDSKDILDRTETSAEVQVKHVLLGWDALASVYGGRMDPRAAKRSNADAAKLAQDVLAQLKAKPEAIDDLVKQHSEDPGSASGEPYEVKPETGFVPEFKKLALRLKLNEAGIVRTQYGYHVIERVPPPPPDPLESADILARPAEAGPVQIQHVLVGWMDTPAAKQGRGDPRAAKRTKAEADKIAKEVLDKAKAGEDMAKLMKEYSEDPGSKETGKAYEVGTSTPMVPPFKNMSLRLKLGEVGLVKSAFGWHVMKRVPPPAPDNLESADILGRAQVTPKAKVKHILLGWKDVHADDPRGKARDRATLEKLVKDTVAKLKGGSKIEPLMAELSEDPGSAKNGQSYDVTPDAGLVVPFKNLSLRLNVNEVGVVKTDFGIHIIQRTE